MKLISQLSKETGIPVRTIRFYEKAGLFSGVKKKDVTTNNYVYYDQDVVEKIRFIKMAKAVGFTLAEIREVVDAWYKKQFTKNARLRVLDKKLVQLDEKSAELKAMKKQIAICKDNIENDRST